MSDATVRFSFQGVAYEVPAGLTVMRALEYAGLQLVHGCGCRAGFCGACAMTYRLGDDPTLRVALGCQTPAVSGMDLSPLPNYPVHRADFAVAASFDPARDILRLYPELSSCLGCNSCTRSCPAEIDVLSYVGALLRGDLRAVARLSFDCISCSLCTVRCPAGITPFWPALQARRAVGRQIAPRSATLSARVAEIQRGVYDDELRRLKALDPAALEAAYRGREIRISDSDMDG